MTDDKDRRIQDLENAIKVQAQAVRNWESLGNIELIRLRKLEVQAYQALNQLDSEREMNAILTDEVEQLRKALGAMIYETTHLSPMEDDGSHWCKISGEALAQARKAIKAGEHLK